MDRHCGDPMPGRMIWLGSMEQVVAAGGPLSAFVIAAATTPVDGPFVRRAVLAALVAIVTGAGWLQRHVPVVTVAMASCSFDFFHIEPIRELHLDSLPVFMVTFGVLGASAVAARSICEGRR